MPIYTSTSKLPKPEKPKKERVKKERTEQPDKPKRKFNAKWIVAGVCLVAFVLCVLPTNIFRRFFTGVFGLVIYPALVCTIIISLFLIKVKKYKVNKRYVVYLSIIFLTLMLILQLILCNDYVLQPYGKFLDMTYSSGISAGGLLLSLILHPLVKLLGKVGTYITLAIMLAIFVSLLIEYVARQKYAPKKSQISTLSFIPIQDYKEPQPITLDAKNEKDKAEIARIKLGLSNNKAKIISSDMPDVLPKKPASRPELTREYILTPPEPVIPPPPVKKADNDIFVSTNRNSDFEAIKSQYTPVKPEANENKVDYSAYTTPKTIKRSPDEINNFNRKSAEDVSVSNAEQIHNVDEYVDNSLEEDFADIEEMDDDTTIDDVNESADTTPIDYDKMAADALSRKDTQSYQPRQNQYNQPNQIFESAPREIESQKREPISPIFAPSTPTYSASASQPTPPAYNPAPVEPVKVEESRPYVKPPVSLLKLVEKADDDDSAKTQDNIDRLEKSLEEFKVPAKVIAVTKGPAVTRYELSMPSGISVKMIERHAEDIAYALASNGAVRIEAPIPGKNAVGIEVPNDKVSPVYLQEIISSKDYWLRQSPICMALGKDISGNIQYCNLDKLYHVLVAGSTGSGKSVCLNTMILSMIYKASPDDLRIILVDPKRVEFSNYNGLPHLLTPHVITEKAQAINALNWAIKEMERRYMILQKHHVVNIKEYNNMDLVKNGTLEKMKYIVIIIDELADLMSENKREIEERLMRLAQKARASGIHLIVATQRPSVDVITGTIKTNFPSRIAFALTNFADSKTVLDCAGAESLLGKGDMLFKPNDAPMPRRVQGAYVSSEEINAIVDFVKMNNPAKFDANIEKEIFAKQDDPITSGEMNTQLDPLAKQVLRYFIESNSASASGIQRRFGVGFARAGRIMDQLEYHHFISKMESGKPRQVLVTLDDLDRLFPN